VKKGYLLLIVALVAALGAQSYALTVEEIIDKNIQAKGGVEKLKAVMSKKMRGRTLVQGVELPFTIYQKRPSLFRMEATMGGQTVVQAYDGETAWAILPGSTGKPQKMPSMQAKAFRTQADFDGPLVGYEEAGFAAELVGKEKMDGSDVYHLKLTTTNDSLRAAVGDFITHIYLDAKSFLECKITIEGQTGGTVFKVDSYPVDYKEVGGIVIAHSIETKMGDQTVSRMVYDKIETNVDIDDSVFKMPGEKGKEQKTGKE